MITRSGVVIDLSGDDMSGLTIEDVAWHLSLINRFNGATHFPYSVAQHSVFVSKLAPQRVACKALLHDAHEALIGHMCQTTKGVMAAEAKMDALRTSDWCVLEDRIVSAVRRRFGLPSVFPREVKEADELAFRIEIATLLTPKAQTAFFKSGVTPEYSYAKIVPMTPQQACHEFLTQYAKWGCGIV